MGQKYATFYPNGFIETFYDEDISKTIPENAVKLTDEQYLDLLHNSSRRRYNFQTNQIEEFEPDNLLTIDELKQQKLTQLSSDTTAYILQYYPQTKQQSDIADKEFYGSMLLSLNSNYTTSQIYKDVYTSASNILSGKSTLQNEVSKYPQAEQQAWEQLIKVAFVNTVKKEYYQIAQQIQSATNKEELDNIKIQFNTKYPL